MLHDMKVTLLEYRTAIGQIHGCQAGAVTEIVDIVIPQDYGISWRGKVYDFEVHGHPTATRCSAWPEAVNNTMIIIHAILHHRNINSAEDAVRSVLRRRQ